MGNKKIVFGTLILLVLGCEMPEKEGTPFEMHLAIPQKRLVTNTTPVECICYIDPSRENPLNAKDYVFAASAESGETQFFNYVVLGYAYLAKDSEGYVHLEIAPALKYILDNSIVFIKPLHQKGMQVLIEVRSGNFSDTQEGIGLGLGTMDMAAIDEFRKELKLLVEHYGIDGFDFNDVGGGKKAYPPLTRELKQFRSDKPLYEEALFKDAQGKPLSDQEITSMLWIEGGSNFSNLIQRLNEELKQTYTSIYKNGSVETSQIQKVERSILVRGQNHGRHLLSQLRMAYMPDAYSGADPKVDGNLKYVVNDTPYDNTKPHASFWDETQKRDVGADIDGKYAPFTVDLSDQKDRDTARRWAYTFLLKDPDGLSADPANQNRYGALYFSHLQPASVSDMAAYLTYFSRVLFGRTAMLVDRAGAGDYQKDW